MGKKLTTEEFIKKAKSVHGDKYDYSKTIYTMAKNKLIIICSKHGAFEQIANSHIKQKYGCRKCGTINCISKQSLNESDIIEKAKLIHGNKYNYSLVNYKGIKTKIKIICKTHGEFLITPDNHIHRKGGCPICKYELVSKLQTSDVNTFIIKAKEKHFNKYDYSSVVYNGCKEKIKIICPSHGIFKQTPDKHVQGDGCPKCNSSKGEIEIEQYLIKNRIDYKSQYKFKNCININPLPFDFYLPDYNMCIEFNGRQHYESISYFGGQKALEETQKRDKIKIEYCYNNNISLLIIKHNEKIEDKLNQIMFTN